MQASLPLRSLIFRCYYHNFLLLPPLPSCFIDHDFLPQPSNSTSSSTFIGVLSFRLRNYGCIQAVSLRHAFLCCHDALDCKQLCPCTTPMRFSRWLLGGLSWSSPGSDSSIALRRPSTWFARGFKHYTRESHSGTGLDITSTGPISHTGSGIVNTATFPDNNPKLISPLTAPFKSIAKKEDSTLRSAPLPPLGSRLVSTTAQPHPSASVSFGNTDSTCRMHSDLRARITPADCITEHCVFLVKMPSIDAQDDALMTCESHCRQGDGLTDMGSP